MEHRFAAIRCFKMSNSERLATAICYNNQILQVHPYKQTFADVAAWKEHWANEYDNNIYYEESDKGQENAKRLSKALENSQWKKKALLKQTEDAFEAESPVQKRVRRIYDQFCLPNTICSSLNVNRPTPLIYGQVGQKLLPIYFHRKTGLVKTAPWGEGCILKEEPTYFYRVNDRNHSLEIINEADATPLPGQKKIVLFNQTESSFNFDNNDNYSPQKIKEKLQKAGFHVILVHSPGYDYRVRELLLKKYTEDGSVHEVIRYSKNYQIIAEKKFNKFTPYELDMWLKNCKID